MKAARDMAVIMIAVVFVSLWWEYRHDDDRRKKLFEGAAVTCGGLEKLQWVQFGDMWGGFGFGCMPKGDSTK